MRGIKSTGNLIARVEGDIGDVDGVLKITTIRMKYELKASADDRDKVERALENYADKCPAYQSVKNCIDFEWDLEMT